MPAASCPQGPFCPVHSSLPPRGGEGETLRCSGILPGMGLQSSCLRSGGPAVLCSVRGLGGPGLCEPLLPPPPLRCPDREPLSKAGYSSCNHRKRGAWLLFAQGLNWARACLTACDVPSRNLIFQGDCVREAIYIDRQTLEGKGKSVSRVRLSVTAWTAARQAPLSVGVSRQEHWSGLPFPCPRGPS